MASGRITVTNLMLMAPVGALVVSTAGSAEAAAPTYYNSLPAFQADITSTVTDNYSNPGYAGNQNNAAMNAVLGETDYMTTGFANWNLIVGAGHYCAGCNGSFELAFQTTTVGNAIGVNGVGFSIMAHDNGNPYYAFITFGDGTTANIQLPAAGSFWGVAAPERIERIHIGLSNGAATQGGYFEMDNLIVGDGNIGTCEVDADCVSDMNPCTDPVCNEGLCGVVFNAAPCDDGNECTDEACSGGVCTPQFNTNSCDDEEVCTEMDVCALGVCQGSLVSCEDGNVCTTNYCDFGVGCAMLNNNAPCDDGNVCTEMDACSAGTCGGAVTNCSDDDVCTMDSCDPELGCVSEPTVGCCVGDEDCGAEETCDLDTNACVPVSAGSSGPGDTGVDGTGDGDSGVVTSGSDTGGVDTGIGGSTGADTGAGLDGGVTPEPDFSGCECTTTPAPQGRLWWLVAGLGLFLRRRRRTAA